MTFQEEMSENIIQAMVDQGLSRESAVILASGGEVGEVLDDPTVVEKALEAAIKVAQENYRRAQERVEATQRKIRETDKRILELQLEIAVNEALLGE